MSLRRRSTAVAGAALAFAFTTTGSGPAPTPAATGAADDTRCFRADEAPSGARPDRTGDTDEGYVEAAYERALARGEKAVGGQDARADAVPFRVKVYVHVIQDSESVGVVSDETIAEQIEVLNDSYAGTGNTAAGTGTDTKVTFELAGTTRTVNPDWYPTSYGNQTAANAFKAALRQGGRRDLNLYLTDILSGIIGWATFPDEYAANPVRDGVVVDNTTVPGGSAANFNLGFTATHEVGHWLGLFHTFEGGCAGGDLVDDTAPEGSDASGCPIGRNTCAAPGDDPIHNFMDYSDDACYYEFTPGQSARVQNQTATFRNSAPTVTGASLATTQQSPVSYSPTVTDPEGDVATLTIVSPPAHGTATANAGSVTYTPAAGFGGQDAFALAATDAFGLATPATVTVTVAKSASTTTAKAPKSVKKGKNVAVDVTVAGSPAPSGTVQVTEKGKVLGTGTLVGGKVTIDLGKKLKTGKHTLTVSYAGSAAADASSTTVKIKVKKKKKKKS